MTTYVDASALVKHYLDEVDSSVAEEYLTADPVLVTSWITEVEVRRNLARALSGKDLTAMRSRVMADLEAFAMVSCDEGVAHAAAEIGEALGVRSLDAIHLASAQRLRVEGLVFLTFDLRQGQAARSLGFVVRGC